MLVLPEEDADSLTGGVNVPDKVVPAAAMRAAGIIAAEEIESPVARHDE